MYIFWLQRKKIVLWTLTSMLRGVSNRPVKIFCAYFGHIYIFLWCITSILSCKVSKYTKIWSADLIFGIEKIWRNFDRHVIFTQNFDHTWPAILYRAQSCAGQRAHDSKCLNEVYKAYITNHILYKKILVKPNWVEIRQILAPLDLTLIWKLGPDG